MQDLMQQSVSPPSLSPPLSPPMSLCVSVVFCLSLGLYLCLRNKIPLPLSSLLYVSCLSIVVSASVTLLSLSVFFSLLLFLCLSLFHRSSLVVSLSLICTLIIMSLVVYLLIRACMLCLFRGLQSCILPIGGPPARRPAACCCCLSLPLYCDSYEVAARRHRGAPMPFRERGPQERDWGRPRPCPLFNEAEDTAGSPSPPPSGAAATAAAAAAAASPLSLWGSGGAPIPYEGQGTEGTVTGRSGVVLHMRDSLSLSVSFYLWAPPPRTSCPCLWLPPYLSLKGVSCSLLYIYIIYIYIIHIISLYFKCSADMRGNIMPDLHSGGPGINPRSVHFSVCLYLFVSSSILTFYNT